MHFIRNPMCSLVVRLKTISPWIEFCLIEYKVCKTNFVDCLFFFFVGRCRCIVDQIYAYTVVHDFFCGSDGRGKFLSMDSTNTGPPPNKKKGCEPLLQAWLPWRWAFSSCLWASSRPSQARVRPAIVANGRDLEWTNVWDAGLWTTYGRLVNNFRMAFGQLSDDALTVSGRLLDDF